MPDIPIDGETLQEMIEQIVFLQGRVFALQWLTTELLAAEATRGDGKRSLDAMFERLSAKLDKWRDGGAKGSLLETRQTLATIFGEVSQRLAPPPPKT